LPGCLRTYNDAAAARPAPGAARLITLVQTARAATDRGTAHFHTRLGLTALHLAAPAHPKQSTLLCADLAVDACRTASAYPALELLDDPLYRGQAAPELVL
jgi:hypothetical protein